jgi:hypothetical protein
MAMVDLLAEDLTLRQAPTLTELEEARAGAQLARQIDLEWLMASDDPPDVGVLLAQLVNRPAWHALANCRGADPDLFFPERGTHRPVEALAYCEECSVRSECLASALEVSLTRACGVGRPGGIGRACGAAWRDVRGARLAYSAFATAVSEGAAGDERTILGGPTGQKVTLQRAVYLGGLPGDKGGYKGNLIADDECLGMGMVSPKKSPVRWDEMDSISFDSETAAKSRVGKALLFEIIAFAAKNAKTAATITVTRKDGNVAIWQIDKMTGAQVRAKLQPFMFEHGVKCLDDAPLPTAAPAAPEADPAEQLKKLGDLHDSGLLTDEEFAAKRAALVDKL